PVGPGNWNRGGVRRAVFCCRAAPVKGRGGITDRRRRRGGTRTRPDNRTRASGATVGIARRDEPRAAVGRARPPSGGARTARSHLRLVHRRLRHARSERGEGAAGRATVSPLPGPVPPLAFLHSLHTHGTGTAL